MDAGFKYQLKENGVDVETTIKRFGGNEDLYQKFLMKFLNDSNYDMLKENLEQKNYEEAFKCAHTLKGVTANLGLNPLCETISDMVELLRNKTEAEIAKAQIQEKWEEIERIYDILFGIISANQ